MIGTTGRTRVFAYCAPVDMRKGFEGLSALVREQLGRDPLDGAMYLFTNKTRTRANVLSFDGTGLWVYAKRLERGRFVALWKFVETARIVLTKTELELFLAGSHLIGRFAVAPPPMTNKDLEVRSWSGIFVGVSELDRLRALPPEDAKALLLAYAKENDRLHRRLQELVKELAEAKGTDGYAQLELELSHLQERLTGMQRQAFGDSSERRPKESPPKETKPQTGHGPRPQPNLPIENERYSLGDDDRICPKCGGHLEELNGMTEDADVIDMVERRFVIKHRRCQKYGCGCTIHTAPSPVENIKGGRYTLQFAVGVVLAKYCDHAPLTRQCRMMKRQGLVIDSQTLWDQIEALARHLVPAYEKLRGYILGADVVRADETWWRLMGGGKGNAHKTKRWWAWSITTPDAVWHRIAPSRSAAASRECIGEFEGTLMVDGYKAYDVLAKGNSTLRLAHCWAHARRKFVEAESHYPQCGEALELIGQLFGVDRGTRDPSLLEGEAKLEAERERAEKRNTEARPLVERLRAWALEQRGLPKSGLRKAIDYMLRHWDGLTVFVDDPYVPLDNNGTERALRGMVIGRKNHYGSRSKRGTEVTALFYSLVETALLNDVDVANYLYTAAIFSLEFNQALLPWKFAALPDGD